jgi:hypothetical protein
VEEDGGEELIVLGIASFVDPQSLPNPFGLRRHSPRPPRLPPRAVQR